MDVFKRLIKQFFLSFSLFSKRFPLLPFHSVLKLFAHKSLVMALIIAQLQLALSPALALYEELEEKNRRLTLQVTPTEIPSQFHLKVGLNDGDNVEATILDQIIHFQHNSFTARSHTASSLSTSSFLKQAHDSSDLFSFVYRDPLADLFKIRGEGFLKFSLDASGNLTVETKDNMAPTDFVRSLNIINQGRTVTLKGQKKGALNLYGLEVQARHLNKHNNVAIQTEAQLQVARLTNNGLLTAHGDFFRKEASGQNRPDFSLVLPGSLINEGSIIGSSVSILTPKAIQNANGLIMAYQNMVLDCKSLGNKYGNIFSVHKSVLFKNVKDVVYNKAGDIRALKGTVEIELAEGARLRNLQDKVKAQEDFQVYQEAEEKDKEKYTHRGRIVGQSVIIKRQKSSSSTGDQTQPLVQNDGGLIRSTLNKKHKRTPQENWPKSFIQFENVKLENLNEGSIQSEHGMLRYLGEELINRAHLYSFSHMIMRGGTFKHLGAATLGLGTVKDTLENPSKPVPYGNLYLYMNKGYEIDHDISTLGDISIRLAGNYWPIHLKAHETLQVDLNQKRKFLAPRKDRRYENIYDINMNKLHWWISLNKVIQENEIDALGDIIIYSRSPVWDLYKSFKTEPLKISLKEYRETIEGSFNWFQTLGQIDPLHFNKTIYKDNKRVNGGCNLKPENKNQRRPGSGCTDIFLPIDIIARGNIKLIMPYTDLQMGLSARERALPAPLRKIHSKSGNIQLDVHSFNIQNPQIIAGLINNEVVLRDYHNQKSYYGSIIPRFTQIMTSRGLFQAIGHIKIGDYIHNKNQFTPYEQGKKYYGCIILENKFQNYGGTTIKTEMHIDDKDKFLKYQKIWGKNYSLGRMILKNNSCFSISNGCQPSLYINCGGIPNTGKPVLKACIGTLGLGNGITSIAPGPNGKITENEFSTLYVNGDITCCGGSLFAGNVIVIGDIRVLPSKYPSPVFSLQNIQNYASTLPDEQYYAFREKYIKAVQGVIKNGGDYAHLQTNPSQYSFSEDFKIIKFGGPNYFLPNIKTTMTQQQREEEIIEFLNKKGRLGGLNLGSLGGIFYIGGLIDVTGSGFNLQAILSNLNKSFFINGPIILNNVYEKVEIQGRYLNADVALTAKMSKQGMSSSKAPEGFHIRGGIVAPLAEVTVKNISLFIDGTLQCRKLDNFSALYLSGGIVGNINNKGQIISNKSIENLDFASEFRNAGVVIAPVINFPQARTFESPGRPNYRAISSSPAYQDAGVLMGNHSQALTTFYQSFTSAESYRQLNQSGLKGVYLPLTPILSPLTMDLFIQKMGGIPRNLEAHLPFMGSMGDNASSLAPPSPQDPYFYISRESHLSQALVPYQSTPLFIGHTPSSQDFYPYLLDPALEAKFIHEFLTQSGKELIELPADLTPEMIWAALRQNGARYGRTQNALMSRNGTSQALVLQTIDQRAELAHPILFYHLMPVNGTMMYVPHLWMKGVDQLSMPFTPLNFSQLRGGTILAKQVNVGGIGSTKMSLGGDTIIAQLKATKLQSFEFSSGSPQIGQAMIQADDVAIRDRVKLGDALIKFNRLITDQTSYTEADVLGLIGQHVINRGRLHANDHGLFYVDYWQNIKNVLMRRLTPEYVNSWEIQHRDEPEFEYTFQIGGDVTGRKLTFWVRRLENNLALISASDQLDLIIQELVSTGVIKAGLLNYNVAHGRVELLQHEAETIVNNKTTKKRFWGLSKETIYWQEKIRQKYSFPADKSGVLEAGGIVTGAPTPDKKFLQLVERLLPPSISFLTFPNSKVVNTLEVKGGTIKVGAGGLQLRGALDFIVLPNVDISLGSYTKSSRSFFHSSSSSSAARKEKIVRPAVISIAGMDIEFGRDISLTATDVTAVKSIKMKAGNTVSFPAAYARDHNHETHQETKAEVTKINVSEENIEVEGTHGVSGVGTEMQAPEGLISIKAPQGGIDFRLALESEMIKINDDSGWTSKETTTTSQNALAPTFIAKKGVCFAASENCAIHLSAPRIMATNGDVVFNAGVLDIMGQILKNTYSSSKFSATQTEDIYTETPVFVPYQIISNGTIYFNVNTANLRGGDIVAHTIIDDSEHMTLGAVKEELNYSYNRSGFSNGGHKTTDTKGGKEHMLPTSLHLTGDWISTHKPNGTLNWQGVTAMIMGNLSAQKSFHLSAQELKEWSETTTTFVGISNPVWDKVNAIASGKRVGAALEDFVKNDPWVAAFDKLVHMDMKGPDGKVNLLLNAINGYCRTVDLAEGIGNISDLKSFGSFLKDRYSAVSLKVTQDTIKTQSMTDVGSNVHVGGRIYVNAPEWSIKGGSQVKAKTVEAFVKKFSMDAGKTTFKQETSGWNASVSMGADGGMSASGGMYDHEVYQKIYQASTLTADKVFLRVSEDIFLRGSRVLAEDLDVKVEGNVWVESVQDEHREKGKRVQVSTNATPSGGVTDKESRTTGDGKAALQGKTSEKIEVKGTTTQIHPADYHRDSSFHVGSVEFKDWETVQEHFTAFKEVVTNHWAREERTNQIREQLIETGIEPELAERALDDDHVKAVFEWADEQIDKLNYKTKQPKSSDKGKEKERRVRETAQSIEQAYQDLKAQDALGADATMQKIMEAYQNRSTSKMTRGEQLAYVVGSGLMHMVSDVIHGLKAADRLKTKGWDQVSLDNPQDRQDVYHVLEGAEYAPWVGMAAMGGAQVTGHQWGYKSTEQVVQETGFMIGGFAASKLLPKFLIKGAQSLIRKGEEILHPTVKHLADSLKQLHPDFAYAGIAKGVNRSGQKASNLQESMSTFFNKKATTASSSSNVGRPLPKVPEGGVQKQNILPKNQEKLRWDSWRNYEKTQVGNNEYAKIGERLYTRHAVDRMQPSTLGNPAGQTQPGRNLSPNLVEEIIRNSPSRVEVTPQNVQRTIFSSGSFEVVTEQNGHIIVTVKRIN